MVVPFLDWLSLKVCSSLVEPSALATLRGDTDTILCISPDGEEKWESHARLNTRSDTHQLAVGVGGFVSVTGSPARFVPDDDCIFDNVFGSLDIVYCAKLMISHIETTQNVKLPHYKLWSVTRIDVTQNYFLKGGSFDVKQVLSHWRHSEMSKYKVVTYEDSIYVQKGNKINSGKAYYKGPQLLKDYRKRFPDIMNDIKTDFVFDDTTCQLALDNVCSDSSLNDFEILEKTQLIHERWRKTSEISKRLKYCSSVLRMEATFGNRFWNESAPLKEKDCNGKLLIKPFTMKQINERLQKPLQKQKYIYRNKEWYNYTEKDLKKLFDDYFDTRLGKGVDVKTTKDLSAAFRDASLDLGFSETLGKNAYKTYIMIQKIGKFNVYHKDNPESEVKKSSFNKHKKIAMHAGLTHADWESGEIIPFKRRSIDFVPVSSWEDLRLLAG